MYLLKLRRDEAVVPSTLLWSRLVADVEANAPWQRLRRSLLLLLQLLLVICLALLAARPFLERPAGLARDLVLIVDASASMGATDVMPNRLEAAKDAAIEALRDLPIRRQGQRHRRRPDRPGRRQRHDRPGRVRQAIASIETTASTGDLGDALRLASALAARSGDAEILVATDAALADVPTTRVHGARSASCRWAASAEPGDRRARVRTAPSGAHQVGVRQRRQPRPRAAGRRIEVYGDGALLEARDVVIDAAAPGRRRHRRHPQQTTVGRRDRGPARRADDRRRARPTSSRRRPGLGRRPARPAQADPARRRRRPVPRDRALATCPTPSCTGVTPARLRPRRPRPRAVRADHLRGLPAARRCPRRRSSRSPRRGRARSASVTGTLDEPGHRLAQPRRADPPLRRPVDDPHRRGQEARPARLGAGGHPRAAAARRCCTPASGPGCRTAVLAFEPRRSDLPLQVAFPILLANLTGELLGGSAAPRTRSLPGTPVTLPIPAGATGVRVERPDGTTVELAPGTAGGASVTFCQTDLLGVYTVTAIPAADASADARRARRPDRVADAGAEPLRPAPAPAPRPRRRQRDPTAPIRFAVDLFDVDESNIAPGCQPC